jgi:hypothetical protein
VAFRLYSGTFERLSRREDSTPIWTPKIVRSSGVLPFAPQAAFRELGAPVDNLWKASSSLRLGSRVRRAAHRVTICPIPIPSPIPRPNPRNRQRVDQRDARNWQSVEPRDARFWILVSHDACAVHVPRRLLHCRTGSGMTRLGASNWGGRSLKPMRVTDTGVMVIRY